MRRQSRLYARAGGSISALAIVGMFVITGTPSFGGPATTGAPTAATPDCSVPIGNVAAEVCYPSVAALNAATPSTIYIAADDYSGTYQSGALLQWTTTYNRCSTFTGNQMPSGWGNRVRSVHTYSGCASTVFAGRYYTQPEFQVYVDTVANSLGAMNGRGNSQTFCSYDGCPR
jgi:hypothetical protein